MGFFKNLLTNITTTKRVSTVQMVQERGNGFYSYNGKMYQSDIVRACIRPKIKAIGKLTAKHIRETITAQTPDEEAIDMPPDAAALIPLYIAAELYKEDELAMATVLRNEYEDGLQKLQAAWQAGTVGLRAESARYTTGWC